MPTPAPEPPATLDGLLSGRRIVVCLGAGGVGKTTVSAAVAVHLAGRGRRTLCLTIDPARRLAESLGITPGSADEVAIPAERLTAAGLPPGGSLTFAQLDPVRTFDAAVRRSADPATADRVLGNRLYRHLTGQLPGVHEFMAMERFFFARADGRFDALVHDTPPTSNALDFLEAPRRLAAALDSPFLAWMTGAGGAGFAARAGGRGLQLVLRLLTRFTGPGLLEEMSGLLRDSRSVLEAFRARALEVDRALRGPDVAFVLVTSPEPQAVDEVVFVDDRLAELRIPVAAFVVNRVRPRFACSAREAAETAAALSPDLVRRLRENAEEQSRLAEADENELARLRRRCGPDHRYFRIPAFASDVRDLPAITAVSRLLFSTSADAESSEPVPYFLEAT